ncbi:MAG: S8 family serine peptidase [Nevskiaceae bacterium]
MSLQRLRRLGATLLHCVFAVAAFDAHAAELGPGLQQKLAAALPTESLEIIVSFHGERPLTASQRTALALNTLKFGYFRHLPVAGAVATPAQIERLARLPEVRSVWHNDPLEFEMEQARTLSSVEQLKGNPDLRNAQGLPFTGAGVAILVNDSGIDGTHPDLMFGAKVKHNALGHTNLKSRSSGLPFTPTEGMPHTDLGGSHGTHVAGIAAGLGTMSDGRFAGAAIGADLIGYGSGGAILVLDTLGGFDYALQILNNPDDYPGINLRVVTNSFGSPSQIGQGFNPADPTSIATNMLRKRGVVVVFSAGNSGSGPDTITGGFKKAPWIVVAGNGQKNGTLAPSSSRGPLTGGVSQVTVDGELLTVEDRPTVVAPGSSIVATRTVTTADATGNLDFQATLEAIGPEYAPFYAIKTGTSMAAPHVAGLVAILLEANPGLSWREVKQILKQTATNMSGYEPWEAGAGHANIEAAVAMALALRDDYGQTSNLLRAFNSNAVVVQGGTTNHAITFQPAPRGQTGEDSFAVGKEVSVVVARWQQPLGNPCTCAVVLLDPAGNRYGSAIALPQLGPIVSVAAPGMEGIWTVTVRGIGSVSGVAVDPAGVTNGVAGPATASVAVTRYVTQRVEGLSDIAGHPAKPFIEVGVRDRLVDGQPDGAYHPNDALSRGMLAEYLVMGFGIRQSLRLVGSFNYSDVEERLLPFAEIVSRSGVVLADLDHAAAAPMSGAAGLFNPGGIVTRKELAFSLVRAMGGQSEAEAIEGELTALLDGERVEVTDAGAVPAAMKGHLQIALDLGLIAPSFYTVADPVQGLVVKARALPDAQVTRGEYAGTAFRGMLNYGRLAD